MSQPLPLELTDFILLHKPDLASDTRQNAEACAALAQVLGCILAAHFTSGAPCNVEASLATVMKVIRETASDVVSGAESVSAHFCHEVGHA